MKKEKLTYDWWPKDMAPSSELRKAFNHDKEKFDNFRENYLKELNNNGGKNYF